MDSTRRFSSRVENYERYRPGYPGQVVGLLREGFGLTAEAVVADVGSGTGLLSRLFLENGNRVLGVEPNPEMRSAGDRILEAYDGFTSVDATAEETCLAEGSVDFAVAGQAFHWFDPDPTREEFARILRPGGWTVLVWNSRRREGSGFLEAYEELLEAHGTDYAKVRHDRRGGAAEIRRFFSPRPVYDYAFTNEQVCDLGGLKGRALSSSYVPQEGEPGYAAMMTGLEEVFRGFQRGGTVALEYDTRVYVGGL